MFEAVIMIAIHASIVAAFVAVITRWTNMGYQRALAVIGAVAILLFVICIGIPFFFQGYAEWNPTNEREPLGWTRNPLIGLFAYLYSFKWMGFAWLSMSIACLALGRFSTRIIVDTIVKSALIVLACIMLTKLYAFAETINLVLE